jgi:hypothetical protein
MNRGLLSSTTSTGGWNLPNRSPGTPPYAICASRLDATQGEVCSGARLNRAGEAPGKLAGGLSCPVQLFQLQSQLKSARLPALGKEFRILSSATRRMISPTGKSICLLFLFGITA